MDIGFLLTGIIVGAIAGFFIGKYSIYKAFSACEKQKTEKDVIVEQQENQLEELRNSLLNESEKRTQSLNDLKKAEINLAQKIVEVKNLNQRIDYLSNKLRLNQFLNNLTGELSSGQKNRVSLAKSIINKPEVLLLDEPTASLDPETGDFVRSFLEDYQKENEASILLASHNMNEVERLCSSVFMMKNGVIIDQDSPNELIKKHGRKNLEEVFLKLTREKYES